MVILIEVSVEGCECFPDVVMLTDMGNDMNFISFRMNFSYFQCSIMVYYFFDCFCQTVVSYLLTLGFMLWHHHIQNYPVFSLILIVSFIPKFSFAKVAYYSKFSLSPSNIFMDFQQEYPC